MTRLCGMSHAAAVLCAVSSAWDAERSTGRSVFVSSAVSAIPAPLYLLFLLRCICSSCSAVSALPRKVCRAGTPQFFRLPLCRFKPRFCALTYFDAVFSEAFVLHGAALQASERCEQPCCPLPPPWQADTVFRLRRRRRSIP